MWKKNFERLLEAAELGGPVSFFYQSEQMLGYISCVDPVRGTFFIEMPGEYEQELEIEQVGKIDCNIFSVLKMEKGTRIKIWVDDIRNIPEGYIGTKSVKETILLIEEIERRGGEIELLDLDHDLGDYAKFGGDAIKILDYLVEYEKFYPIKIHTANPIGRANMERILKRYWTQNSI